MKLLSVNVSLPKEITFKGKTVRTGIFKEPVQGRLQVQTLNIEGDGQADQSRVRLFVRSLSLLGERTGEKGFQLRAIRRKPHG